MVEVLEERCLLDGSWTTLRPMPTARLFLASGVIAGQLYAVGGAPPAGFATTVLEAYDPVTDTWATKTPAPTSRTTMGAGVVGGKLHVVGGCIDSDCRIGITNRLEVYDPATNTWTTRAPIPTPRANFAVGVIEDKLYVVGGFPACPPCEPQFATLEVYDPVSDTWVTKAPMPTAREALAAGAIDGKLYAVGGFIRPGNVYTGVLEVYDPTTNTWATAAPMPTSRELLAVGVIDGKLYAVGGANATGILDALEVYDPSTNTWSTELPMPTARYGLAAGVIGTTLYAVGGSQVTTRLATLEAFTPTATTLTATGTTLSATAGQRFAAVAASFTDAGPSPGDPTDYSAVITWGDGSRHSTGGISDTGGRNYDVAASHTYTDAGTYTITVTITDRRTAGRTATATGTIQVDGGGGGGGSGGAGSLPFLLNAFPSVSGNEPNPKHLGDGGQDRVAQATDVTGPLSVAPPAVGAPVATFATQDAGIVPATRTFALGYRSNPADRLEPVDRLSPAVLDLLAVNLLL
jgi:N-acetylneuraminic acid mutarotase